MDGTILSIGTFTQPAAAVNQLIQVPSDLDYLRVYNWTQIAAVGNPYFFYWTRNNGTPTQGLSVTVAGVPALTAANSFVLYNPNLQNYEGVGAAVAITNINNGSGVVLTATTTGLSVGSVVRLSNLVAAAAQQLGGLNLTVSAINPGVSFTVTLPTPTAVIGATAGFYRIIFPSPLFAPRAKTLLNISAAAQAVVTTSSPHGFSIGQLVRFNIPMVSATEYGITQLDGVSATVVAVGTTTTFTINVNTVGMGAFAFPAAANVAFSYAEVTPYGDDTATALSQVPALSSLQDAVNNSGVLGMVLATGAALPAGVANDVITWEAGKVTLGGL